MHVPLILVASLVLAASSAAAQIPEKFENLKVFPADVPRAVLVQRMREFSFALGVRCEHCHVEESPGVVNRYASDARPAKAQARAMLAMVKTINGSMLAQLPSHAEPAVTVDCVTCHRGLPLPKTLQTTLYEAVMKDGAAAAVERYRQLRKTDFGTGRYNFGEWETNELARRLAETGRDDAAVALLEMNAEFYPSSADIDVILGELQLKRGQREQAIARFRAALAKVPDHPRAKMRVEELERKPN